MRTGPKAISLALAGAALLGASTALEANASAPAGGAINLFSHPTTSGTSGTILIGGAIGDHGRYLATDRNGKPDPQGSYLKIILKKGTFEINATSLTDKPQAHDTATCSAIFSGTASTAVLNGTVYTPASKAPSTPPNSTHCSRLGTPLGETPANANLAEQPVPSPNTTHSPPPET